MTYEEIDKLEFICGTCANKMRFMGEWPINFPKDDKPINHQQTYRWICETCRLPRPNYEKGVMICVSLIKD